MDQFDLKKPLRPPRHQRHCQCPQCHSSTHQTQSNPGPESIGPVGYQRLLLVAERVEYPCVEIFGHETTIDAADQQVVSRGYHG